MFDPTHKAAVTEAHDELKKTLKVVGKERPVITSRSGFASDHLKWHSDNIRFARTDPRKLRTQNTLDEKGRVVTYSLDQPAFNAELDFLFPELKGKYDEVSRAKRKALRDLYLVLADVGPDSLSCARLDPLKKRLQKPLTKTNVRTKVANESKQIVRKGDSLVLVNSLEIVETLPSEEKEGGTVDRPAFALHIEVSGEVEYGELSFVKAEDSLVPLHPKANAYLHEFAPDLLPLVPSGFISMEAHVKHESFDKEFEDKLEHGRMSVNGKTWKDEPIPKLIADMFPELDVTRNKNRLEGLKKLMKRFLSNKRPIGAARSDYSLGFKDGGAVLTTDTQATQQGNIKRVGNTLVFYLNEPYKLQNELAERLYPHTSCTHDVSIEVYATGEEDEQGNIVGIKESLFYVYHTQEALDHAVIFRPMEVDSDVRNERRAQLLKPLADAYFSGKVSLFGEIRKSAEYEQKRADLDELRLLCLEGCLGEKLEPRPDCSMGAQLYWILQTVNQHVDDDVTLSFDYDDAGLFCRGVDSQGNESISRIGFGSLELSVTKSVHQSEYLEDKVNQQARDYQQNIKYQSHVDYARKALAKRANPIPEAGKLATTTYSLLENLKATCDAMEDEGSSSSIAVKGLLAKLTLPGDTGFDGTNNSIDNPEDQKFYFEAAFSMQTELSALAERVLAKLHQRGKNLQFTLPTDKSFHHFLSSSDPASDRSFFYDDKYDNGIPRSVYFASVFKLPGREFESDRYMQQFETLVRNIKTVHDKLAEGYTSAAPQAYEAYTKAGGQPLDDEEIYSTESDTINASIQLAKQRLNTAKAHQRGVSNSSTTTEKKNVAKKLVHYRRAQLEDLQVASYKNNKAENDGFVRDVIKYRHCGDIYKGIIQFQEDLTPKREAVDVSQLYQFSYVEEVYAQFFKAYDGFQGRQQQLDKLNQCIRRYLNDFHNSQARGTDLEGLLNAYQEARNTVPKLLPHDIWAQFAVAIKNEKYFVEKVVPSLPKESVKMDFNPIALPTPRQGVIAYFANQTKNHPYSFRLLVGLLAISAVLVVLCAIFPPLMAGALGFLPGVSASATVATLASTVAAWCSVVAIGLSFATSVIGTIFNWRMSKREVAPLKRKVVVEPISLQKNLLGPNTPKITSLKILLNKLDEKKESLESLLDRTKTYYSAMSLELASSPALRRRFLKTHWQREDDHALSAGSSASAKPWYIPPGAQSFMRSAIDAEARSMLDHIVYINHAVEETGFRRGFSKSRQNNLKQFLKSTESFQWAALYLYLKDKDTNKPSEALSLRFVDQDDLISKLKEELVNKYGSHVLQQIIERAKKPQEVGKRRNQLHPSTSAGPNKHPLTDTLDPPCPSSTPAALYGSGTRVSTENTSSAADPSADERSDTGRSPGLKASRDRSDS